MSEPYRVPQRLCDFPEWPKVRKSLGEQLKLENYELERIGDTTVGDSLDFVETVMALDEALNVKIQL